MESARSPLQLGSLPEEVLSKIFEYVCFEDRQNLRPVCKHWNEILSFSKFTKNEVLRLQYKYDSNDSSVYESLPIPQHLFKWDIVTKSRPFYKIIMNIGWEMSWKEHLSFYNSIGRETKILETKIFHPHLREIDFDEFFKCFPKLETLLTDRFDKNLLSCQSFPRKSLKHLHVPELKQFWSRRTKRLLRDMEKVTADSVTAYLNKPRDENGSPIFTLEGEFSSFMEGNRDYCLSLGDFNLAKSQVIKVTDVRAIDMMPQAWLKLPLEKFEFLEMLHLDPDEVKECANVHNSLNLPLVRDISVGSIECHRCLKTLVSSFPKADKWTFNTFNLTMVDSVREIFLNITDFYVICDSNFFQVLIELNTDRGRLFQKLERLSLGDVEFDLAEECDWPPMPRLRILELGSIVSENILKKTALANIISATPSVREFICLSANIDEEDMRAMATGWPYLKSLHVRVLNISKDEAKGICKNLKSIIQDDDYDEDTDDYDFDYSKYM